MLFALREIITEKIKRSGAYALARGRIVRDLQGAAPVVKLINENLTTWRQDFAKAKPVRMGCQLYRVASSSGTTGVPLVFTQPISALQEEQAYIDYLWSRGEYNSRDRMLIMRGTVLPAVAARLRNRLVFSAKHWSDADIAQKYSLLTSFLPPYIDCYPSVLEQFIRRCQRLGLESFPTVKAVFAGSESCYLSQRQLFYEVFGAQTISWYGQSEQVALSCQDENGDHHFFPGYSDVAFIERSDHGFEIAGRSLLNPCFGHRYYRTGDYVTELQVLQSHIFGCRCIVARHLTGRTSEFITTSEALRVPFNQLLFGLHGPFWGSVEKYCFVHPRPGVLYLLYVPSDMRAVQGWRAEVEARMPAGVQITFKEIKLSTGVGIGKWRYLFTSLQEAERAGACIIACD